MISDKDFRSWLMANLAGIGDRVHQDFAPQFELLLDDQCAPTEVEVFVFFSRVSTTRDRCLQVEDSPDSHIFAVEIIGPSSQEVKNLTASLFALDGYQGSFGSSVVYNGVFVESQDDDYVPFNPASEFGLFTSAVEVEVIP